MNSFISKRNDKIDHLTPQRTPSHIVIAILTKFKNRYDETFTGEDDTVSAEVFREPQISHFVNAH